MTPGTSLSWVPPWSWRARRGQRGLRPCPPADVSDPEVEFPRAHGHGRAHAIPEEPEKGSKRNPLRDFVWAVYGYSKDWRKN